MVCVKEFVFFLVELVVFILIEWIMCFVLFVYGIDDKIMDLEFIINCIFECLKVEGKEFLCIILWYFNVGYLIEFFYILFNYLVYMKIFK